MSEYGWGDVIGPLLPIVFGEPQLPEYAMRVGPGTDAVVWKICDTSHEVCEL